MTWRYEVTWLTVVLAMVALPALANDLDECAFNKTIGTCSATFSLNRETSTYTIPAVGSCRTVTVQIDGTQYPHKQKDSTVIDSVMVLDKTKPYEFQISGCTAHPTRSEVIAACRSSADPVMAQCQAIDAQVGSDCANSDHDKFVECAVARWPTTYACIGRVADAYNACIGARAWKQRPPSDMTMGLIRTGEY